MITKPTVDVALTMNHGHFECHCKNLFIYLFIYLFIFMKYFNLKSWPEGVS